jgi:hypothetical protein
VEILMAKVTNLEEVRAEKAPVCDYCGEPDHKARLSARASSKSSSTTTKIPSPSPSGTQVWPGETEDDWYDEDDDDSGLEDLPGNKNE